MTEQPIFLLHQPQLPENIGAVARAMGNFGLNNLRIINPVCEVQDPKAIATAAGAEKILADADLYATLEEAIADLNWVYGTCATQRHLIKEYIPIRQAADRVQSHLLRGKVGLLFGPERTGLSNDQLARCHGVIQIPVNPDFSSMNLAQASVIMAYELSHYTARAQADLYYGETCPASQQQLNAFLNFLETKLDDINYWRVSGKKPLMKQNIENVFTRMQPAEQDLRSLWGMIDLLSKKNK
ncbi:MAG: RNA methyltransferase [Candidatus Paracaedibacteraceae bacterium]|nr:RNA methyltransferase [Candidatus Paracaedibacteraceae bacterium]